MFKPYYLLPALFCLLVIQACNLIPQYKPALVDRSSIIADSLRVKTLIARGIKYKTGNVDSLPRIAWELESISKMRDNKVGLIYAAIFKTYHFWLSTDYESGMKVSLKALADAEKFKLTAPIPEIYSLMANMSKENGNYAAAFENCARGLQQAKLNRDTDEVISLLGLNAMLTHGYYHKIGKPQNDHSSLQMQLDALKMAESSPKYEKERIKFYDNIAQGYKELKQYDKAIFYGNKAVALATRYKQQRSLTYGYNWLGEAYYYMGQHDKGIGYMDSAIAISRQLKQPYREMEIYEAMHYCYVSTKNYEPAIMALRRSAKLRDSLQIAKNEKQISEMQLRYDAGGKDKQIALLGQLDKLKSQKILRITVAMVCFVVLMFIILYQYHIIYKYNRKVRASNVELNDSLLKIAHIQSHEIRKPLASILGLMNVIKSNNYKADKEVLEKMDTVAQELDERIREVITQAEVME